MKKLSSVFFTQSFILLTLLPGLLRANATDDFLALLKKVKATVPVSLKGYQSSTLIGGRKEASANFSRNSSLAVDLDAKTLSLRVIDPHKKMEQLEKVDHSVF